VSGLERPRRGSFVAELTLNDVREIYELRAALESRAARLIIERDHREALSELGVQQAGLLNVFLRLEIKTQYETLAGILDEHVELFRDLNSGDGHRAEAGCDRHMREALERVTNMLEHGA
jgi:DNA-binding GntR family transcriptional regulator